MLNPVPREAEGALLALAPITPISLGGVLDVLDAVHRTTESWYRMVNTLDDLATVLKDVDEGRF